MLVGERIKCLRILSGLSQEQLADIAGVNRSSVVSWERGAYGPSSAAVETVASVLLCPPGYILFGSPVISTAMWQLCPPRAKKYIEAYRSDLQRLIPPFVQESGFCRAWEIVHPCGGRAFLFDRDGRCGCQLRVPAGLLDVVRPVLHSLDVPLAGEVAAALYSQEGLLALANLIPAHVDVQGILDMARHRAALSGSGFSDTQILAWAKRHGVSGDSAALRRMFEDAATAVPNQEVV